MTSSTVRTEIRSLTLSIRTVRTTPYTLHDDNDDDHGNDDDDIDDDDNDN